MPPTYPQGASKYVALEAEAILAILSLWEAGSLLLISSEILAFEVARNPHPQRRAFVSEIIARANTTVMLNNISEQRAKELEQAGFKAFDALHLALAEIEQVDYFCTCDDRLIKKAQSHKGIAIRVVSPLELAQEVIS